MEQGAWNVEHEARSTKRGAACPHPTAHTPWNAPPTRSGNGARGGARGLRRVVAQAPSTPVTGWMPDWTSAWRSSACSPVTRYTTRLATDTAWSAKRS